MAISFGTMKQFHGPIPQGAEQLENMLVKHQDYARVTSLEGTLPSKGSTGLRLLAAFNGAFGALFLPSLATV
jgi:hypothetical protein